MYEELLKRGRSLRKIMSTSILACIAQGIGVRFAPLPLLRKRFVVEVEHVRMYQRVNTFPVTAMIHERALGGANPACLPMTEIIKGSSYRSTRYMCKLICLNRFRETGGNKFFFFNVTFSASRVLIGPDCWDGGCIRSKIMGVIRHARGILTLVRLHALPRRC